MRGWVRTLMLAPVVLPFAAIAQTTHVWSSESGGFPQDLSCNGVALALEEYNGVLYAGRQVSGTSCSPGQLSVPLLQFSGTSWSSVPGSPQTGAVQSMLAMDLGAGVVLVVGGSQFSIASSSANIGTFDGSVWSGLATGLTGPSPFVTELASYAPSGALSLYAAGNFDLPGQPGACIARWDATFLSWQPVGSGLSQYPPGNRSVSALQVFDGELWIGGLFGDSSGPLDDFLLRWNGSAVSGMGLAGRPNGVSSLGVHNGLLVVGGASEVVTLTTPPVITPLRQIAFFDPGVTPAPGVTPWSSPGTFTGPTGLEAVGFGVPGNPPGTGNPPVAFLSNDIGQGSALYITGSFTHIIDGWSAQTGYQSTQTNGIAVYAAQLDNLDGGLGGAGTALEYYDGPRGCEQIAVVGNFTVVDGSLPARQVAFWGRCYADCNCDGVLNVFDQICFGNEYSAQSSFGDCDKNGQWNIFDYICYSNFYAAGCP